MTGNSRLRWIVAVAAIAATAWLLSTCGHGEDVGAPPAAASKSASTAPVTKKPRSRGATGDASNAAADAATASRKDDVPVDDAYPFIDVEVVNHDGTPAGGATVYALVAGKPYAGGEPPNVSADARGRCRLHVLRRGMFDVGAMRHGPDSGGFAALAIDIDAPRADLLRIALPAPADVAVSFAQPLVPAKPEWEGADIQIQAAGDEFARFPGRGQTQFWNVDGRMDAKSTLWTAQVPAGVPCRVRLFDNEGLLAAPSTFEAPTEVSVRHVDRYALKLNVTFEPPDATFPHAARLEPKFYVDEEARPASAWTVEIGAHQRVADAEGVRVVLFAGAALPDGEIRWKGEGVVAESAEFHGLSRERDNVLDVQVRVADDPPAPPAHFPDALLNASVTLDERAAGAPTSQQKSVWFVADDGSAASRHGGGDKSPALVKSGARWALAACGDWAADVVALDPNAASSNVSFAVAPGGYLTLEPQRRLPPSLGDVVLRRQDGAPFLTTDKDGGVGVGLSVAAQRGTAVGPLPPGEVVFVAAIRGEVVGELRATVRAGERTPLKIPSYAAK